MPVNITFLSHVLISIAFFFLFLQTGQETDFILVSCSGSGIESNRREQVLKAKKVLLCVTT